MQHDEDDLEYQHWYDVMRTFLLYEDFFCLGLLERQKHLNRLPQEYADCLPDKTFDKLNDLSDACKRNQDVLDGIVDCQNFGFYPRAPEDPKVDKDRGRNIHSSQMHRNQAVLHSLAREWSTAGESERRAAFNPILTALAQRLPVTTQNVHRQRVLVPGCGLARLPVEIVSRGYACEANEYSMFMLTASHFMLNDVSEPECYDLYPWIDRVSNIVHLEDVLRPVKIPDVVAADMLDERRIIYSDVVAGNAEDLPPLPPPQYPRFSMAAGNFVELYSTPQNKGAWDAIVTCFFLDTAPVVMDYLKTIKHALKPGGYWINIGPLLYHWATSDPGVENGMPEDERYAQSVELSWEELEHVISKAFKFEILEESWRECTYTRAKNSMLWHTYNAKFFVATKPLSASDGEDESLISQRQESAPHQHGQNEMNRPHNHCAHEHGHCHH